jgi:hypothetical protein
MFFFFFCGCLILILSVDVGDINYCTDVNLYLLQKFLDGLITTGLDFTMQR